jgi:hypothetical protein
MSYTFLFLDLALLIFPFFFALDQKVFKTEIVRSAIVPSLFQSVVFLGIALFFVQEKVWTFNNVYTLGHTYQNLPFEAYLFVFALGFAGLAIYNYLNLKFPNNELQQYSLSISNLLLGVFVAVLFFARHLWFPLVTVVALMVLLLGIEYLGKLRFMYRFYRAFVVCLIPIYISFWILGNTPILQYNFNETMGAALANVPVEVNFYMMGMLLLEVFLLEYLKNRSLK